MDIRIVNGHIIDPLTSRDHTGTVAIKGNRIIEDIPTSEAELTLDAEGCYVFPGLVDFHTHVFEGSLFGIEALLLTPTGVTSVVDAGSCGCAAFEFMHRNVMATCRLRIKAFLNVATTGQPGRNVNEDVSPENYNRKEIAALVEKYPHDILGLKVRISSPIVGALGIAALDGALELAEEFKLPLCVHVTNPPVPMNEVACRLRPGDIFCHVFQGIGHTILGGNGRVLDAILDAAQRGVIFDAANGRVNFDFDVAQKAILQGFFPDVVSSDVTKVTFNRSSVVKSLPFILSKYLNMGVDLPCLVRATTMEPARLMHMEGQIGTLKAGALADVAIFKLVERQTKFSDFCGKVLLGDRLLIPQVTILDGQIAYCANDFSLD